VADLLRLDDVQGFVFDVDGTLVLRGADGRGIPQPGAAEVLEKIRSSGRPFVLFTNGSHVGSEVIAHGLREDGLPIGEGQVLTPIESATTYLLRRHRGRPVMLFASEVIREQMASAGVVVTDGVEAEAVFVAHVDNTDLDSMERAARAVHRGAALLTGSYVRGYAGANGIIFSRGAMITAAIAKATGARPRVLGKPSRAAVAEVGRRLGLPTERLAVIGDDLGMDVALGRMGGSRTVLVRTGITGATAMDRVPPGRRPDAVVDGVADLLDRL
jgi:HAD superfamily hydrolase (TIGR01450 family)